MPAFQTGKSNKRNLGIIQRVAQLLSYARRNNTPVSSINPLSVAIPKPAATIPGYYKDVMVCGTCIYYKDGICTKYYMRLSPDTPPCRYYTPDKKMIEKLVGAGADKGGA